MDVTIHFSRTVALLFTQWHARMGSKVVDV